MLINNIQPSLKGNIVHAVCVVSLMKNKIVDFIAIYSGIHCVLQLQIPVSQQQWYHRNNFIPDDASLERAGVMNDSIVEVRPAHQSLQRTSDQPSSRFQAP